MATIDGVSALAVIVIASFAIDRITTGALFVLSFIPAWVRWFPDPQLIVKKDEIARARAEKQQKLLYFGVAALLALPLLGWFGGVRIFSVIGFPQIDPVLDTVVTGLILVAGSDRIAGLLKTAGVTDAAAKTESQPIQITGKLVLEEESSKVVRGRRKKSSAAEGDGPA